MKLLTNIDDVNDNLGEVKKHLACKIDEVSSKVLEIEKSNMEMHEHLNNSVKGLEETLIKKIDDKIDDLIERQDTLSKTMEESRQTQNQAVDFFKNYARDLIDSTLLENKKLIKGVEEKLIKKIDDKIDHLIERQDTLFKSMEESRKTQNQSVDFFKNDARDLIEKVNEVSEKIMDFEKNKRNNLILFGIPDDPEESPSSLDGKVNDLTCLLLSMQFSFSGAGNL
jgi:hypothetical protein